MESNSSTSSMVGIKTAADHELEQILHWWINHMTDPKNGGFYGRIDSFNHLHEKADKGIILNTRILWTFAAAARITQKDQYRVVAEKACQYILHHFWDVVYEGVYWMLNNKGEVVNDRKQIYAQAFAIYAFSEHYLLTEDPICKEKAIELFWLIERYSLDKKKGGYLEAFNNEWGPLNDLRLSEKDMNVAKTMNTHLHILEAYTNLFRIYPHNSLADALRSLIQLFLDRFINPETYHLNLFFDENWTLKSEEISFGHDIETSWLLVEAAEVLRDEDILKNCQSIALKMVNAVLDRGMDSDGGLFNEGLESNIIDSNKHWWPQAEAVVGFLNAYQISGQSFYLDHAARSWEFIQQFIKDPVGGEWHWMVDQSGKPILGKEDKAGAWKAPYHNGRACMECTSRIMEIIKA